MLNANTANAALQAHANANTITAEQVATLLDEVRGTTFAQIAYVTQVATAAAHKTRNVQKVTVANVQLFNNINDFSKVYAAAVKRSAAKHSDNDAASVDSFVAQSNYFEHTDCFSVVQHKKSNKAYLYAIYNAASSAYYIDGVAATKQEVAALLTASAAAKMMDSDNTVHNVTHDIVHNVQVRTIALENIVSISAAKQMLQV